MKLILTTKRHVTGNIWTFVFAPSTPLSWQAGQFIKVNLPHTDPDEEGTARRFTIASAPHEAVVRIVTRVTTTSFKRALSSLPISASLDVLDSPAGDFIWVEAPRPHLFVAQGIGITPFYAIIEDCIHRGLNINAHLIFANRPGSDIPFGRHLIEVANRDRTFEVTFQTHPATPHELSADFPDLKERIIYISGPKSLVALCAQPYNLPSTSLKQDIFPNYPAIEY